MHEESWIPGGSFIEVVATGQFEREPARSARNKCGMEITWAFHTYRPFICGEPDVVE